MDRITKMRMLLIIIIVIFAIFLFDYGILTYSFFTWNRVYFLEDSQMPVNFSFQVWHLLIILFVILFVVWIIRKIRKK